MDDADEGNDEDEEENEEEKEEEEQQVVPSIEKRTPPRPKKVFPPRPSAGGSDDKGGEVGVTSIINQVIKKLARDDSAYVSYTRVRPQIINGQPAGGWSRRIPMSALISADDLLEQIDNESGGTTYDLKFYGTDSMGKVGYVKGCRININSPAKLRTNPDTPISAQNPGQPMGERMAGETFNLMKDMLNDLRNGKGPQNGNQTEFLHLIKEIATAQLQPTLQGYTQTINMQQKENDRLHKRVDELQSNSNKAAAGPSSEILSHVTDKAQDAVMQLQREFATERSRWESERATIVERANTERTALVERSTAQIDRLTEKLHDVQEKFEDRLRSKDEQHAREKQGELDRLNDRLGADIKHLQQQLIDERHSSEKLREMYELNTRTQLEKQEGVFKERIESLGSQIKRSDERQHDLEKQRDELQKEVLAVKTAPRPDGLESTKSTITTMTGLMSAMGWSKDGGGSSGPPVDEPVVVQWMRGAKEAGIVDAAKGIVSKVADAIGSRQQVQQQSPQVVYQPVYVPQQVAAPQPQPIFQPAAAPPMQAMGQQRQTVGAGPPQGFAAPAGPPVARQTHQVPRPAPAAPSMPSAGAPEPEPAPEPAPAAEMSEMEFQAWSTILQQFEAGLENGVPPDEMSKTIQDQFPPSALRQVLEAGVGKFMQAVTYIVSRRTDNPETSLDTPRGQTWLREVFSATARAIGG